MCRRCLSVWPSALSVYHYAPCLSATAGVAAAAVLQWWSHGISISLRCLSVCACGCSRSPSVCLSVGWPQLSIHSAIWCTSHQPPHPTHPTARQPIRPSIHTYNHKPAHPHSLTPTPTPTHSQPLFVLSLLCLSISCPHPSVHPSIHVHVGLVSMLLGWLVGDMAWFGVVWCVSRPDGPGAADVRHVHVLANTHYQPSLVQLYDLQRVIPAH